VRSRARRRFWERFDALPAIVQHAARKKYKLWRSNPAHPSLHFKELGPSLWSIRINDNYRALALREKDLVVWFWIGTHAEYDRLIER
jgi:hypothetical protein